MRGDLEPDESQVHDDAAIRAAAEQVLAFWFGLDPERHWAKDPELDAEIGERFGVLRDQVFASGAAGWRDHPETLLAAVILLDQFSRNIHRGTAAAFSGDDLAATLTLEALSRGYDRRLDPERRIFLLMPLMHAEDAPLQEKAVEEFEKLGVAENIAYARDHRDVLARFGRFPGRNAALGRKTSAAEQAWLDETGGGW